MKKVQYLAGAVGAAAPILALITPAGNAAAAVTHETAANGKTVSVAPTKTVRPYNYGGCNSNNDHITKHGSVTMLMYRQHGVSCIARVSGNTTGKWLSIDMRTRYYNRAGGKIGGDHINAPTYYASPNETVWHHTDTVSPAYKACIALVAGPNQSVLDAGPVCATISS